MKKIKEFFSEKWWQQPIKLIKVCSTAVLIGSLVFAIIALAQPVEFHKTSDSYYDYYDYLESYNSKGSLSSSKSETSSYQSEKTESYSSSSVTSSKSTVSSSVSNSKYNYYTFSFVKIGLPKEYATKISVYKSKFSDSVYKSLITVYEKASLEQAKKDMDEEMGLLFEIGYVNISSFDEFEEMYWDSCTVFAKDSSRYYIYKTPTDYQFYRSNGETSAAKKEWEGLQDLGNDTKNYIIKNNTSINSCSKNLSENNDYYSYPSGDSGSNSVITAKPDCVHCGGSGACKHCYGGDCPTCYGRGTDTCDVCFGDGDCSRCGGYGYTYSGTGQAFDKRSCSRCGGDGRCNYCNGVGKEYCVICGGDGNCNRCFGTALCQFCNGSGKSY